MENILIIANPTSGQGIGVNFAKRLGDIFMNKGIGVKLYKTEGDDDFKSLVQNEMDNGFDTMAVLGGDGTISAFSAQITVLEKRPDILLVPLGTTNNLAQALNTELDMELLLEKVKAEALVIQPIDVGQIGDNYFVSTLSAGSLPEIAWKADDEVKEMFGSFGYILEGITSISEDETFDLKIQTSTEDIKKEDVSLVVVGLSNSVFGIPTFFEDAQIDDGKLHLYALQTSNLMEEAASLARHIIVDMNSGQDEDDELSYVTAFHKASIETTTNMNLTVDGEKGPTFPIELDVLHNHLTFLVPQENKKTP